MNTPMKWNDRPYRSLDYEMKRLFGHKMYKLSLESGMTCPNRDGTCGDRGCIFCSEGGSGDFAAPPNPDLSAQIEAAKAQTAAKLPKNGAFGRIGYFQSFTNTYAPYSRLESLFTQAVEHPDLEAISIGTRPDCLPDETVRLLERLNRRKPVWVELGLQTIHEETALLIRRGYPLPVFEDCLTRLKQAGLTVIVHVILGLPGESREMMMETVRWLAARPIDGIKLQLLHILKGTDLASLYRSAPFPLFTEEEYLDFVIDCVEALPPSVTIHRLTGDGPKSLLIAPLWSANKRQVLNRLQKRFKERNAWQGRCFQGADDSPSGVCPTDSPAKTAPSESIVTP